MKSIILFASLVHIASAAPQIISFKDGKVGVNFLGYHAQAGLGGDTANSGLFGVLHASAATPWGQNAAAGLKGNVNGPASGILYARAQATPVIGATSAVGDDASQVGLASSKSYGDDTTYSRTKTISQENIQNVHENYEPQYPLQPANINVIQKIRPSKKVHVSEPQQPVRRQLVAMLPAVNDVPISCTYKNQQCDTTKDINSDVVQSALQIPIGILQSLQQTLGNIGSHGL